MIIDSILAVAALLISLYSIWYTRKQFQTLTTPSLDIRPDIQVFQRVSRDETFLGLTETRFLPRVKNLSSNVAISEVQVVIEVATVQGKIRSTTKEFFRETFSSLDPLNVHASIVAIPLEPFLCKYFPEFFHVLETHYSERDMFDKITTFQSRSIAKSAARERLPAYQLSKPCTIDLLVRVDFLPGIHNADTISVKRQYIFSPMVQSGEMLKTFLADWEIKEV